METDISQYIKSFINKEENLSELLNIYISISNSQYGCIFLRDGNKHICIKYSGSSEYLCIEKTFKFEPITPVKDIIIVNEPGYKNLFTPYKVETLIIIPIIIFNNILGVVCLINNVKGYTKDIIEPLTPYIGITQLILNKNKLINDFKKVYSDSASFSKDLFIANMSHEIRTPLNGIIGYNQLLMRTGLTSIQKGYLMSMNQCSIQLMQIINDVLDFSKLASGKMNINIECFRVREIIESLQDAMGMRLNDKKQKLNFVISEEFPEFIISDKQKIIQIIINLVSNASKFSDMNKVIDIYLSNKISGFVKVSVVDKGIGISEQNQCKLFNAFVQIEDFPCKIGTGLGLAICKKLVELLEGEIFVESAVGIGSTFSFTFKYEPYEEFEKIIEKDVGLLNNKSILVVDDNADNRILLFEILFEWGMNPVMCASALEALRMIMGDRYKFSLALIDICMPGTSGVELATQIKEEKPFFPLIALSSLDSFVSSSHFEKKLDKPINKLQLFNAIYSVLIKNQIPSSYLGDTNINCKYDCNSLSLKLTKCLKILIIEDIIYNSNILKNMLENLSYNNINIAENGEIALSMIKQAHEDGQPYDIILLDLRMPVMNGYDVMASLNNINIKPNIVIVSASVMDADKDKCRTLGAKYFITKPVDIQQLKDVMLYITNIENYS